MLRPQIRGFGFKFKKALSPVPLPFSSCSFNSYWSACPMVVDTSIKVCIG